MAAKELVLAMTAYNLVRAVTCLAAQTAGIPLHQRPERDPNLRSLDRERQKRTRGGNKAVISKKLVEALQFNTPGCWGASVPVQRGVFLRLGTAHAGSALRAGARRPVEMLVEKGERALAVDGVPALEELDLGSIG